MASCRLLIAHSYLIVMIITLPAHLVAQQTTPATETPEAQKATTQKDILHATTALQPTPLRFEPIIEARDPKAFAPPSGAQNEATRSPPVALAKGKFKVLAIGETGTEFIVGQIDRPSDGEQFDILNRAGVPVGYFQKRSAAAGTTRSLTGVITLHFAGAKGPLQSTTEISCSKSGNTPSIDFTNARWRESEKSVEFDLRSNCALLLHSVGGTPQTQLNITNLSYLTALKGNDSEITSSAARINIAYGSWGESLSIRIDSDDTRQYRRCIADARQNNPLRVCLSSAEVGYQLAWLSGGDLIEREFGCGENHPWPNLHPSSNYFVGVCSGEREEGGQRYAKIALAQPQSLQLIEFGLECSCKDLTASRFHFDRERRTLSFNLGTDANEVKFEGHAVRVVTQSPSSHVHTVPIPIAKVTFNEHWQIIELMIDPTAGPANPASAKQDG